MSELDRICMEAVGPERRTLHVTCRSETGREQINVTCNTYAHI